MGFGIDIAPIIHWVRSPAVPESIKPHTLDGVSKSIVFGRKCAEAVMGTLTSYLGSGAKVDRVAVERQSLSDRSGEQSEKCENHLQAAFPTVNALNTSRDINPASSSDIERSTEEQQIACEIAEELKYQFLTEIVDPWHKWLWDKQLRAEIAEDNFISDLFNSKGKSEEEMQRELEAITDEYGLSTAHPRECVSDTDSTISAHFSLGDNAEGTGVSQKPEVMTGETRLPAEADKSHPIPTSTTLIPQITPNSSQYIRKETVAPESPSKIPEKIPIRSNFSQEVNNQVRRERRVRTSRPEQKMVDIQLEFADSVSSKGPAKLKNKTRVTKPQAVSSRLLEIPEHRKPTGQKSVHQPLAEGCAKWPDNLRKTITKEK